MRFRTKTFLSAFAVAALSLLVAAALVSWSIRRDLVVRVERNLEAEARLAARLLSERPLPEQAEVLDREADAIGAAVSGRVTFIAPDGRVLGDSAAPPHQLASLDNHRLRPEVVAAFERGFGASRRYSTTVSTEMLYVAVRVDRGPIAIVRIALSLDDVGRQVSRITRLIGVALGVALSGALLFAWVSSHVLARRLAELARVAQRYATGDTSVRILDPGSDELASVARVLDESAQGLSQRVAELSRDRARMAAILSGMVEGVVVVNESGTVQLVNDAARRMLRLDASAEGRSYVELIRHPDIASHLARALEGTTPEGLELSPSHDRSLTLVARAAPAPTPQGSGAVLVLHDITDLRRADRVRRDFVANVSHELRTPLTAIRGYVEALLDAPPPPDQAQRFLEIIARHSERMERLVKDLLRLARLDAGQEQLDRAVCSVEALFSGVVTELEPTLKARGQTVRTEIGLDAHVVGGDPIKLHDVFKNLVENASNYSPERSLILLQSAVEGGRVRLRVLDQGSGIPEPDLGRIFERFYRVDKARSRETGGTGLGLSIVKHLVELHGGDVSADNRPGGGAVFTVSLPAA